MPDHSASDATLPSVVASLETARSTRQLVATLIFHPRTDLWGHYSPVCSAADVGKVHWSLGRVGPAFIDSGSATPESSAMLEDLCISRHALSLDGTREGLRLSVPEGACRCRLNGEDVVGYRDIEISSLDRGVSIALAHTVVLLLHWRELPPQSTERAVDAVGLLGCSSYAVRLRNMIAQAAGADCDVLILGESGTGKELVANAVHRNSARASHSFVAMNMAALTPGLSAAQLFGSVRGAFTGATRRSRGYFAQAQLGTLFLDEIGETPAEIQPQLLRALQEREIQPVGGNIETVDVRVLSATDADLDALQCNFSAALKHRLGALTIELEPLREHREDLGILLRYFFDAISRELDKPNVFATFDKDTVALARWSELILLLLDYAWPGNVRELSNVVRQLVVCSGDHLEVPSALLSKLRKTRPSKKHVDDDEQRSCAEPLRVMETISDAQFERALTENAYEVARVARDLGVSRQAVYRRISTSREHRLASDVPLDELLQALEACRGDLERTANELCVSSKALRGRLRQLPPENLPHPVS